ncbi:MAG: TetR/AcrR family transcriptional regulator [Thermodesulfobacteriota bacterium]|nr:TetR/AcrR family transcriptional regulator [Thermodesulfobacteriota bacterium]
MARVAKGTIYNYFGSKDRVYLEVLRQEAEDILKKISLSVGNEIFPEAKFTVFFRTKFRYIHQAINILNLDREGIDKYLPAAKSIQNDFFEQEVHILDSILREGIEKKFSSPKMSPLLPEPLAMHSVAWTNFHINRITQ